MDNGLAAHRRLNIVYMGMGEPLDNLENLAKGDHDSSKMKRGCRFQVNGKPSRPAD
jgi:hypothetical protein